MKKTKFGLLVFILFIQFILKLNAQQPVHGFLPMGSTDIRGAYGNKIDICIENRIKLQDISELITPFTQRTECQYWQTEFWGKWMASAVAAYRYKPDETLKQKINQAVKQLLATQTADGYIGNYCDTCHLRGWDVWGRKYTMLGLLLWYQVTADAALLNSASRLADHLLTETGPGKCDLVKTGNFRGMPSSTILEPMIMLYKATKNEAYLRFCNYIIDQWEKCPDGPKLISKALSNVPVSGRFSVTEKEWWTWANGQKAYEMMNCYKGLLDLYQINPKPEYLEAVLKTANDIINTEINIAGSGASYECWYHGKDQQTRPATNTMETCVTTTWMKLCNSLLQVTGNSKYADQIEKTFYNALLASMKFDGSIIAKYSPLEGFRQAGEGQCGMHINCCNANGPRGFALIPDFAYMQSENTVFVKYYGKSSSKTELAGKNKVSIQQQTDYPETDKIVLIVNPEKETDFAVALRIPEWSQQNSLRINGQEITEIQTGTYKTIQRKWKKGDRIEMTLDLRGRLVKQDEYRAIVRGPVVLARDTRFGDGFIDETSIVQNENGFVELVPAANKPENVWLAFTAPLVLGSDLESDFKNPRQIHFCDFASAGNTWDLNTRYRVWLRETLNVMKSDYKGY